MCPDLSGFSSRKMIAGVLENTPENLARWLRDPDSVKPGTTMPNLYLSDVEIQILVEHLQKM